MPAGQLRREMAKFYKDQLGIRTRQGSPITSGLGFQRVARLFITHQPETGVKIPTVFYLKPDQRRYWTRSQALRDADELAATIIASSQRHRTKK
jgi:O-succinylbenzoate synthase